MSKEDRERNTDRIRMENPKWEDVKKIFDSTNLINTNEEKQGNLYEDLFKVLESREKILSFQELLSVVKAVELELIRTYLKEMEDRKHR